MPSVGRAKAMKAMKAMKIMKAKKVVKKKNGPIRAKDQPVKMRLENLEDMMEQLGKDNAYLDSRIDGIYKLFRDFLDCQTQPEAVLS